MEEEKEKVQSKKQIKEPSSGESGEKYEKHKITKACDKTPPKPNPSCPSRFEVIKKRKTKHTRIAPKLFESSSPSQGA